MRSSARAWVTLAVAALAGLSTPAHAELIPLTSDPATWRVENYPNDLVVVWYAVPETQCPGRQLAFDPGFGKSDFGRFWAAYTVARNGGPKIFVYYEIVQNPKRCLIRSFGVDNAQ